jgi:hypothetical protein
MIMFKLPLSLLTALAICAAVATSASAATPTISSNTSGAFYNGTTGNDANTITSAR